MGTIPASIYHHGTVVNEDADAGRLVVVDEGQEGRVRARRRDMEAGGVCPTLNDFDNGSESRATVLAFRASQHGNYDEGVGPLTARYGKDGKEALAVAYDEFNDTVSDTHHTLRAGTKQSTGVLAPTLSASNDPSRSPQSSEVTAQVEAMQAATSQVRRLTPRECERLQGFPQTIRTLELELRCTDHPAKSAPAETRNRRLPRSASPADASELKPCALSVEIVSSTRQADDGSHAPVLARIDCAQDAAPTLSLERSLWSANGAEQAEASALSTRIADSVRLLADTYTTPESATPAGRAASPESVIASTHRLSGRLRVDLSGCVTMRDASDAVSDTSTMADLLTRCITSRSGLTDQTSGLTLATSLSYVLDAMTGSIPAETPLPSSWRLLLTSTSDWTAGQADSARYRQMGNAVAVPVVEWIMRRLVEVDRGE